MNSALIPRLSPAVTPRLEVSPQPLRERRNPRAETAHSFADAAHEGLLGLAVSATRACPPAAGGPPPGPQPQGPRPLCPQPGSSGSQKTSFPHWVARFRFPAHTAFLEASALFSYAPLRRDFEQTDLNVATV